jgi:transposase
MSCDDAGTSEVQRFEVFTGAGKRRDWPPEVKASIVAESYSGAETACAVARRHGLSPSQLFTWRREFRQQLEAQGLTLPMPTTPSLSFVPAVIDPLPASDPAPVASLRSTAWR